VSSIVLEIDKRGVATIALNRPEKHNAFTPGLIAELSQACDRIRNDSAVRVLVITGTGSSFCAGADLEHMRVMANASEEENYADALALGHCLRQLAQLPQPCLARVNGSAFGGGLGLIACADIAIGVNNAKFALSEVRLGLVPAVISTQVVAAIGTRQAKRLFLNAATFDAAEAQALGLLHNVTAPEKLDESVDEEIRRLLRGAPKAQHAAKELLLRIASADTQFFREQESFTARLLSEVRSREEAKAGIAAFFAKRSPPWDSQS
jgi:methylglutaconyl-CoA hydratase